MVHFYHKYFTTEISTSYSHHLNMWKIGWLYLFRSKLMLLAFVLVPLVIFIFAIVTQNQNQFILLLFKVFGISISMILATFLSYELNSTSFFKQVIIYAGVRKRYTLIPGLIVTIYQTINLLIIVSYIKIYALVANLDFYLSWAYIYSVGNMMLISILIGLLIANWLHNKIVVYSFVLFFSLISILLSDFTLYLSSKSFSDLSYITPYRYTTIMGKEASNFLNPANINSSNPFNISEPYIVKLPNTDHHYPKILDINSLNLAQHQPLTTDKVVAQLKQSLQKAHNDGTIQTISQLSAHSIQTIAKALVKIYANAAKNHFKPLQESLTLFASKSDKLLNLIMPWIFMGNLSLLLLLIDPLKTRKHA